MSAEIIKLTPNFYICSECNNASNLPDGIPHSSTCSLPDLIAPKVLTTVDDPDKVAPDTKGDSPAII